MKFRNYCIVVMGNMEAVKDDIIKVAETKPRYIDAKGILISTFASAAEPAELKDFFNFNERSFLLFDLDKDNSSYQLHNNNLHNHLFGYLLEDEEKLREMSERIMEDISANTADNVARVVKSKIDKSIKDEDNINYAKLTKKEREAVLNDILDKGIDKLNNSDREILQKLSELK